MVIKRKSKETLWQERLNSLEETLEEFNKENDKISLGGGCYKNRKEGEMCTEDVQLGNVTGTLIKCLYKLEEKKIKIFEKYKMNVLAYLKTGEHDELVFQATSQENIPLLEKICQIYERKTLKDEPIIEY